MLSLDSTNDSIVGNIVQIVLKAMLHYVLYKITLASIVMAKDTTIWFFQAIMPANLIDKMQPR